MAAPVDAKKELDLIEKVEWRILSASSDEKKLQGLLKIYLAPLLLKAGSEHVAVRNKVISTCQTINKLIKAPSIVLPVGALLDQYKATEQALIKHFDLIYIQHSVGKLDTDEQRTLVPKALRGISTGSTASISQLFNVTLRMLPAVKVPPRGSKEDVDFRESMGLADPNDAKFVAEWFGKLLLLRANTSGPTKSPGLTEADINFLTGGKPETWDPAAGGLNLLETRIQVVNLLASGAFTDDERFIPAIYAASSADYRISGVGDDLLKRSSVSLEDETLARRLFEAHSRLPAPYRIRILGVLSKSETATTFTDEILAAFRRNVAGQAEAGDAMQIDGQPVAAKPSGLELNKLHRALFEFINWVARIGPSKTDYNKIGPPLVELLKDFVTDQGWPKPGRQSLDESALRSRAYETIGILAKGASMSDNDRLSLAGWLFRSLSEDPTPDVVVNIDGALSSLTSLFKPPHGFVVNTQLQSILLTYMILKDDDGDVVRSSRHAVAKWANNCLPFSDVYARWIDILAIAGRPDERSDVVEEGHKGLDPWTYHANDDKSRALPDWKEMVQMFFKEAIAPLNASPLWSQGPGMDVDDRGVFVNFPAESLPAFPVAVDYCKRILFLAALQDFQIEPGWERRLGALAQSDLASRQTIRGSLSTFTRQEHALFRLLHASFEGMIKEDVRIAETCARSFVDISSLSPRAVLEPLASRSMELLPLVKSNKKELRVLGSKAFGILAAHPSNSAESVASSTETLITITKTLPSAVGSELNAVEGAFIALAHLVSRRIYYSGSLFDGTVDIAQVFPSLDSVSSATLSTQEALFEAYSQLWTAAVNTAVGAQDTAETFHSFISKAFIEPLAGQAKKGNEKAITALGRLSISIPATDTPIGSTANDTLGSILEKLYSLYEIRQAEVHFAVGEAIAAAVACWDAEVVQLTIDVQAEGGSYRVPKRSTRLAAVLEKLLTDCKTTKPSLLKASGIWLFCVIQHCSHLEDVQSRLRECQVAFMRLLSARDELVQETASRGLALVYEKGDSDLKGELVRDLVSSFTGSGPQLKVDQETELFDAGALPTGDGKSVTSYKDIVSLANEVGDPSLVYKFMSLATNAATWSTRSAFGRFGLSNILSESEIDPKLYPKLYRYRFDPNQNVQRSMNDIWKALVKDSAAVMDTHFESIMKDLLKSILGKEWRVREASCAAISDLVSGRPFQKYESYYKDIWTCALKVLDDVKATVRNAALHLCIALSTTLVRQLEESGSTTTAKAMMNEALPFLLSEKGIESSAEDVKLFATITVMKIAKSGGDALKPYIPTMVPHLLGLLSTIEPEAINYHYQRAGEDNREKIDKLRSAMVSRSPIAEAIENCLRSVDDAVMKDLAPRLQETIKTALGMPTKIGCARVLSTLATRHAPSFAPYAPAFLVQMEKQSLDRNDEVSQNYARAAAYLIRVVPTPDAKTRFADRLIALYLSSEDEARRQKVADAVLALSKISPDHFTALETQLLPFAFLARHDTDEYVRKAAQAVWDTHAGSTSLTVVRYLTEVVALVEKCLGAAQWALKHAGALAVAAAAAAVVAAGEGSGRVSVENLKAVWPAYEKALALKTFEGKEKLLEPFPGFVGASKTLWAEDAALAGVLRKVAVREAKRNNEAYRPHAFRCLWKVAAEREDLDMLDEIVEVVEPYVVVEEEDADAMDVDSKPKGPKGRGGGLDLKTQTVWAALEAVVRGYNRAQMRQEPVVVLRKVVLALKSAAGSRGKTLNAPSPCISRLEYATIRRTFWYDCVKEVLGDAAGETAASDGQGSGSDGKEVVTWFLNTLDLGAEDAGTEEQRLARVKAAKATIQLGNAHAGLAGDGGWKAEVRGVVVVALEKDRSLEVQRAWRDCLQLLE